MGNNIESMTERQKHELEYHRDVAELHKDFLKKSFSFDVVTNKNRRWWNAHWEMYTYLLSKDLKGKNVLVVGCGLGSDALDLAKCGADVKAFDLSPESLFIARKLSAKEGLDIEYQEMSAEKLNYENNYFDIVVARDILHHVDIPESINEIIRVSKPGAIFCFNEVYTHSILDRIRHSNFVENWLYPKMVNFVYNGEKPYITEDERKLTEKDIEALIAIMIRPEIKKYFSFIITRIIPDKYLALRKLDRALLIILSPISYILGGRVLVAGKLKKEPTIISTRTK